MPRRVDAAVCRPALARLEQQQLPPPPPPPPPPLPAGHPSHPVDYRTSRHALFQTGHTPRVGCRTPELEMGEFSGLTLVHNLPRVSPTPSCLLDAMRQEYSFTRARSQAWHVVQSEALDAGPQRAVSHVSERWQWALESVLSPCDACLSACSTALVSSRQLSTALDSSDRDPDSGQTAVRIHAHKRYCKGLPHRHASTIMVHASMLNSMYVCMY